MAFYIAASGHMKAKIALVSIVFAAIILAGCITVNYNAPAGNNAPAQNQDANQPAGGTATNDSAMGAGTQTQGDANAEQPTGTGEQQNPPEMSATGAFQLEDYNSGIFSIKKPVGWQVLAGGSCESFSFLLRDTQKPERQVFYYGEMGPVYLNAEQKSIDAQYIGMGGYDLFWNDMPVVDPLNPENFLQQFYLISGTEISGKYVVETPKLENVEIISADAAQAIVAGEAKKIHAYFTQNGNAGEGKFYVDVAELLPYSGMPAAGIGYAFSLIGLSAEKGQFEGTEKDLSGILESFKLSEDYVSDCKKQQAQQAENIVKAGSVFSGILEEQ